MTSPALQIALAHHRAWTSKDLEAAMAFIADDVVLDAPAGRLTGIQAYREFLGPFAEQFLIRAEMIAAFGDEKTAMLMYDTETVPAKSAPAAECVTVREGKIVYNRFIFDRLPFEEFRRRQVDDGVR
ncbi:nuclear transport factor 2 family protein [Micromonospora sp. KC606]|uniref:nuclear transport factor 2 family protein n=1 Tax=Micromonospora sp. KC606 TaxID=2530379 RepID=UPI0010471DA9|nr:nuclear transport factor 2 family protein [Micromonospora sp. KC606]TDC80679.1 nuclear transport factor 2 family protein [Micromonospora sp. KC606]